MAEHKIRHRHETGLFSGLSRVIFGRNTGRRPQSTSVISSMSRKRRRFKKRKRGSHTAYHLASQAMTKVRRLERKVEVKMHDINLTTTVSVPVTGVVVDLALIAQGNLVQNRDGNKISPFFLTLNLHWTGLAADVIGVYRCIIFRDKRQVASSTPAQLDVLAENNTESMFNRNFRGRWKILYDVSWTSANDIAIRLNFIARIRLKLNLPMRFLGAATTDIVQNGLYILFLATSTTLPTVEWSSRLFYNDI